VDPATVHPAGGIAGWQAALIAVCAAVIAVGASLLVAQVLWGLNTRIWL